MKAGQNVMFVRTSHAPGGRGISRAWHAHLEHSHWVPVPFLDHQRLRELLIIPMPVSGEHYV